ncbi:hypothetical protein AQUCO_07100009v1 [Aquilegia coerulea]|uniref:Uncharacterized protein n=1 Tax=Aquilegia coerulea TaxID=218851 RepID=A0A2G5CAN9_AQUCA|nr:hypothetical protein AQUCO_07100009v1 [Aquilegia coerulea]
MTRGPVQTQFGHVGWPRPLSIIGSDGWARHFGDILVLILWIIYVPLQTSSQSGQVGRERPIQYGNPMFPGHIQVDSHQNGGVG